jgi:hypothetical protein
MAFVLPPYSRTARNGRVAGTLRRASPGPIPARCLIPFGTRRSARFWSASRQLASCERTHSTPTAREARSFTNASAALKGFPASGALRDGLSSQVWARAEHGARIDAPRHPHSERADRCCDRLAAGRRKPRASASRNNRRRQHGRPRPHRRNLSATASTASIDLSIRGRAAALGRTMAQTSGRVRLLGVRKRA